jgi:hypothetical protein
MKLLEKIVVAVVSVAVVFVILVKIADMIPVDRADAEEVKMYVLDKWWEDNYMGIGVMYEQGKTIGGSNVVINDHFRSIILCEKRSMGRELPINPASCTPDSSLWPVKDSLYGRYTYTTSNTKYIVIASVSKWPDPGVGLLTSQDVWSTLEEGKSYRAYVTREGNEPFIEEVMLIEQTNEGD